MLKKFLRREEEAGVENQGFFLLLFVKRSESLLLDEKNRGKVGCDADVMLSLNF
jgi:hypothetical protein